MSRYPILIVALALFGLSCSSGEESSAEDTDSKPNAEAPEQKPAPEPEPPVAWAPTEFLKAIEAQNLNVESLPKIHLEVDGKGTIVIALTPTLAPQTVKQITDLTKKGFFDGQVVHRVENWVIQWGDPNSKDPGKEAMWGTGGSGKQLPFEANDLPMKRGVLAMASTGQKVGGDSQIFILKNDSLFLQGDYAAFGFVLEGMDIVDKIARKDKITMKVVE
ncbi:MAG: peptidylprolyl isomerase [Fimbriimonadales bacterium]|nr:peptidylprolyl isomerase [Fimbriimonadales bacterium]